MKLNFLNQSTEYRRNMILNGNTLKTLLFLSVPTLMLSLVQCLMPLSDSFFINNVAGTYVAGAVIFPHRSLSSDSVLVYAWHPFLPFSPFHLDRVWMPL